MGTSVGALIDLLRPAGLLVLRLMTYLMVMCEWDVWRRLVTMVGTLVYWKVVVALREVARKDGS